MATSEQSSPLPLMATQQAGSRAGKGHCPSAPRQIQWPRGLAGLPCGSAFGVSPPRRTASHCSQALTARRQRDLGGEYRLRQRASSCVMRTEGSGSMRSGCTRRRDEAPTYSEVGRVRSVAIITVGAWQLGSLPGWRLPSSLLSLPSRRHSSSAPRGASTRKAAGRAVH